MRKRTTNSKDARPSGQATNSPNSFRKRSGKGESWEIESRFSKPTIKKSSLRKKAAEAEASAKKPARGEFRGAEKKWDGPVKPREEGSRTFQKPSFDKRRSDGPRPDGFRRERSGGERSFGEDRPQRDFDATKRPFRGDAEPRKYGKPAGERSFDRNRSSEESRPARDFDSTKRPFRGDAEPRKYGKPSFGGERKDDNQRTFKPRGDKPAFEKREFTPRNDEQPRYRSKNFGQEGGASDENSSRKREPKVSGTERRVGKHEFAPRYDLEHYEKKNADKNQKHADKDDHIRLNRFIANAGICSRREADELISSGQITVNGKKITEMGYKVQLTDNVKFGNKSLNPEKMVYVLVNKPKDYITTTEDPEDRKTVLDLIDGACKERIYPVGRLDRNTTGLLLMTNDGELAEKLTHPSSGIKKIYQAELDKPITTEDFELLQHGIELEDGFIRPDEVGIVTPDAMVVGLEIHSGRNRIVRRMFEHLGYEVQKLDRTVFAGLNKKDLPRGKWRFLSEKEVVRLKFML